jgi:hypothetical protein
MHIIADSFQSVKEGYAVVSGCCPCQPEEMLKPAVSEDIGRDDVAILAK